VQVENRNHLQDLCIGDLFVLHAHRIVVFFDVLPLVALGFDEQGAGVHIFGQAFFILDVV
jgi:hypothetical protein